VKNPRADGRCSDCVQRKAETRDGLLCKKCLRKRVAIDNQFGMTSIRERLGRKTLGADRGPNHDNHDDSE
jgi:hypothetical protein